MLKNRLLLLVLFLFCASFSFSQINYEVSINEASSSKITFLRKIVSLNDKSYAISYKKARKNINGPIVLHTYNSEMKTLEEEVLELPNNAICNDLIVVKEHVFFTYSVKNKKLVSYYAKAINSNNKTKDKLLMTIPFNKFSLEMEENDRIHDDELLLLKRKSTYLDYSVFSSNRECWLLPNKKSNIENNQLKLNFHIVKNGLDNLSKFEAKIPVEDKNSKLIQQLIDDEGNVVFLVRTIKNNQNTFKVYSLLINSKKIKELKKLLPNKYLLDVRLTYSSDNSLLINGFYSNNKPNTKKHKRRDQSFTGVFCNSIDLNSGKILTSNLINLEDEEAFEYNQKDYAYNLKDGMFGGKHVRKLKNVLELDNGEFLLEIGKYNKSYSDATAVDKVSSPNAGSSFNGYLQKQSHFILIDSKGNLKWIKKLVDNYEGNSFLYNNKLYLINKPNTEYGFDKENTDLFEYDFKTNQTKNEILLNRKDFLLSYPSISSQIKDNQIVFFSITTGFIFGGRSVKSISVSIKD